MPLTIGKDSYEHGDYPAMRKANLIQDGDKDAERIVTKWVDSNVSFKSAEQFKLEMKQLKKSWNSQSVFYDSTAPKAAPTLYSARPYVDAVRLYWWAKKNGISMGQQFADAFSRTTDSTNDKPFKGHFGDKVHTFAHLKQKDNSNPVIIIIQLNAATPVTHALARGVTTGNGDGFVRGALGLKQEGGFIAVAIGDAKETWDSLKGEIKSIDCRFKGAL